FERMQKARGYGEWQEQRGYMTGAAARILTVFEKSLKDYPPSQESAHFSFAEAFDALNNAISN
ncbi:MAG: hypothetical protein ACK5NK_14760, partial [Niabella sp.]